LIGEMGKVGGEGREKPTRVLEMGRTHVTQILDKGEAVKAAWGKKKAEKAGFTKG